MYPVLKFCCEFTSSFHTSQYNYSNLYTCAPYILGSSLRGVILRALIDTHCTHIEQLRYDNPGYHARCPEKRECKIEPLFRLPTRFSFGEFKKTEESVVIHNRVGISRKTFSQAEGNLLSVEARTGAFTFRVLLPDANLIEVIKEGVQQASQRRYGLGRFQSLGWGQFIVKGCKTESVEHPDVDGHTFRFRFQTPYVLKETVQTKEEWRFLIEDQLKDALQLPENDTSILEKEGVIPRWRSLSYVRRWSDESHKKLNRLVAEPGSELEVHFATPPSSEQMALWQWGIGEWLECGFGSFQFEVVN